MRRFDTDSLAPMAENSQAKSKKHHSRFLARGTVKTGQDACAVTSYASDPGR